MSEDNVVMSGAAPTAAADPSATDEMTEADHVPASESAASQSAQPDTGAEAEDDIDDVDAELEAMKQRLKEMEDEAKAVKERFATHGDSDAANAGAANAGAANKADNNVAHLPATQAPAVSMESDARSIYVGNVDYAATPEELQAHFADCGTINRVTILCHKATGAPKGFAYIEFVDEDAVQNAIILNDSPFRGRPLKVTPKRTNVPGYSVRGGFRGGYRGRAGFRGRGYGHSHRGRPRGRWVPY